MQPMFLPWAGYFRLAANVDRFVFLDDVQLSRQSWQTRNRILVNGNVHWLSVPIAHQSLEQRINETKIADQGGRWRKKTARLLRQSYAHRPFFVDLAELITMFEDCAAETLSVLNIALTTNIMDRIGAKPLLLKSSELGLGQGDRTDRLIEAGRKLACDAYVSPIGARDYLEADGFERRCDMRLYYAAQSPPTYDQGTASGFVSRLSIVDVVANVGWIGAAAYVRAEWDAEIAGPKALC